MAYDEDLAERLREALAMTDGVTEKKMFGGLAFLVRGNMAVAAGGKGGLLVRVDPAEHEALAAQPHVDDHVMNQRRMAGWLGVAPAGLRTDAQLRAWVDRALAYVATLPAK